MLLVLLLCAGLFGDGVRAAPEPASDVILRYVRPVTSFSGTWASDVILPMKSFSVYRGQ
jgi:hypothetical protein